MGVLPKPQMQERQQPVKQLGDAMAEGVAEQGGWQQRQQREGLATQQQGQGEGRAIAAGERGGTTAGRDAAGTTDGATAGGSVEQGPAPEGEAEWMMDDWPVAGRLETATGEGGGWRFFTIFPFTSIFSS